MPFVPAPGTAQYTYLGTVNLQHPIANVLHVQRKNDALFSPFTPAELELSSYRVAGALLLIAQRLVSQVKYQEIRGRDLSSENGSISSIAVAHTGGVDPPMMPPNVNFLAQWRTGQAGQGSNGRSYFPGMSDGYADDSGFITAAQISLWNTTLTNFLTFLGAATDATHQGPPLDLVITHKASGSPLTRNSTKVLTGRLSALVATQRRRLPPRPG